MTTRYITSAYLRKFFYLNNSKQDAALLKYIISCLEFKKYTHNNYICRAQDDADAMYFIESGAVEVQGRDGEIINELQAGNYFGEYAVLTGDKRMADVQAKGTVMIFKLSKKALRDISKYRPGIFGIFLKKTYEQTAEKYRRLVGVLNSKRGISSGGSQKKQSPFSLFINYFVVFLIFGGSLLFAPGFGEGAQPLWFAADIPRQIWLCAPVVFMVGYMIITRRSLEALALAVIYEMILLARLGFVSALYVHVLETIASITDLIVVLLLMGSLTRLFSASGSINAFKNIARRRLKSAGGALLAAFFSSVFIALDEYLSILISGACFIPPADEKRVPREKSAMVMGMAPCALCIISPVSITGICLTQVIAISSGQSGLFLQAVRHNYAAMITLVFVFLLSLGILPLGGRLKKAVIRVRQGGDLWPEGTDNLKDDNSGKQGKAANLLLPVLVFFAAAIIPGYLATGGFQVNVFHGLIAAFFSTFFLYCFQYYMTPEQFFRNIIFGIESMIAPIAIFIMGKSFSNGLKEIGFSAWFTELVHGLIHGQVWLVPAIIFSLCTLMGALFDNAWVMYAVGMPIAVGFAASLNGNLALYMGAVCAAGLVGNEIAMGDSFFIGSMLGVNPVSYYRAKLPYVIVIAVLAFIAFGAAGWFGL